MTRRHTNAVIICDKHVIGKAMNNKNNPPENQQYAPIYQPKANISTEPALRARSAFVALPALLNTPAVRAGKSRAQQGEGSQLAVEQLQ